MCNSCGRDVAVGEWPFCPHGAPGSYWTGDAQIHSSEKVTILENRYTGETRIPGRADRPVHPKLAAEGYQYRTLDSHMDIRRLEKEKGLIHEAGNYSNENSSKLMKDTGSI
jgi:hypothetical protein